MKGLVVIRRCTTSNLPPSKRSSIKRLKSIEVRFRPIAREEPYMPTEELKAEIAAGVSFWGWDENTMRVGVMGIQKVHAATLIRHAYVSAAYQCRASVPRF